MSKNTSIILGEHFDSFISEKVASGRYASASEVIREGLRQLEDQDKKLEALRAKLAIGEAQADRGEFVEDFSMAKVQKEIDQRTGGRTTS